MPSCRSALRFIAAAESGHSAEMFKKLTRQQANRLEQRTLRISVFTILGLAIAGMGYGL